MPCKKNSLWNLTLINTVYQLLIVFHQEIWSKCISASYVLRCNWKALLSELGFCSVLYYNFSYQIDAHMKHPYTKGLQARFQNALLLTGRGPSRSARFGLGPEEQTISVLYMETIYYWHWEGSVCLHTRQPCFTLIPMKTEGPVRFCSCLYLNVIIRNHFLGLFVFTFIFILA